jgi:Na+-transporting methylmalonyl-CoA/oxaloacetate decarboxylase gamma subunit
MYGETKHWVEKVVEGFFFVVFGFLIILVITLFIGVISFVIQSINHDPVRAEKEKVYMAACQSMSGVYVQSNGKNMCFKEGNLIQIDE